MKLRSIALLSIFLFSLIAMPVSANVGGNSIMAQAGNESTDNTSNGNDEVDEVVVQLTDGTELVDYEFNQDNSSVTLHFRSAYKQRVTITDAFIPPDSGMQEINQRSIWVNGEKEITFQVTQVDGKMGVTLQAGGGDLYGVVESAGMSLSANYNAGQVFALILMGVFVGVTLVFGVAYKRKIENTEEIEKAL